MTLAYGTTTTTIVVVPPETTMTSATPTAGGTPRDSVPHRADRDRADRVSMTRTPAPTRAPARRAAVTRRPTRTRRSRWALRRLASSDVTTPRRAMAAPLVQVAPRDRVVPAARLVLVAPVARPDRTTAAAPTGARSRS